MRAEGWRGGMQASTRANEVHKIRTKWEDKLTLQMGRYAQMGRSARKGEMCTRWEDGKPCTTHVHVHAHVGSYMMHKGEDVQDMGRCAQRMGRHNCARQRRAVRSVGQGAISPLDS